MIQEFVSDIDDFIADAQKLKQFVSGPIINIPLTEWQEAGRQATIHTLQGIRDHYIESARSAVTILPDGEGGLNISFPDGDTTEGVDVDEMQAAVERYYRDKGMIE